MFFFSSSSCYVQVLACDGLFDVMTNQQVVDFVRERIDRNGEGNLKSICEGG
jgi:serine/threonine protein phosphatase PrpC